MLPVGEAALAIVAVVAASPVAAAAFRAAVVVRHEGVALVVAGAAHKSLFLHSVSLLAVLHQPGPL